MSEGGGECVKELRVGWSETLQRELREIGEIEGDCCWRRRRQADISK